MPVAKYDASFVEEQGRNRLQCIVKRPKIRFFGDFPAKINAN
jgi:hypothetical protein